MADSTGRRQRPDGTWTFCTADWDQRWYWPVGTRVRVSGQLGTVIKQNSVTVAVKIGDRVYPRVPMPGLVRVTEE
jgi:hypothetical protein